MIFFHIGRQQQRDKHCLQKTRKKNNMVLVQSLSISTLNVNEFNYPIKRQTVNEWIRKQDATTHYQQEMDFTFKDIDRPEMRRGKKDLGYTLKLSELGCLLPHLLSISKSQSLFLIHLHAAMCERQCHMILIFEFLPPM